MKKVFTAGMLAICLIALSQQQASAWCNVKFGVGLNFDWSSGGNNFLWGAYRNGQPPGPEYFQNHSFPQYGAVGPSTYETPYYHGHHHHHSAVEMPAYQYAQPAYASPYQFATYPQPVYYYGR